MGLLSLLFGGQYGSGAPQQPSWRTPPIVPPQMPQGSPLPALPPLAGQQPMPQMPSVRPPQSAGRQPIAAPQMPTGAPLPALTPMGPHQPMPSPPTVQPQRGFNIGSLFGGQNGMQPQNGLQPPSIRSNPLTFALGGMNALRGMYDMQLQDFDRRRMESRDARDETAWERQQTIWRREDQQYEEMQRWIESLPQEQQAAARANPQAAYAAFMEQQAQANAPITPYQREQLNLLRRGQSIDAARVYNDLSLPPQLGRGDQRALDLVSDAADQAASFNGLVTRFIGLNDVQPTGPGTNFIPGSWFGESRERRDEMAGLTSQMISMVRAMSGEGGIMTDADALRFERGLPSVDRYGPTNQNFADASRQVAQNAQDRVLFYESWARNPQNRGSLLGARSAWSRYLQANPIYDERGDIRTNRPGFEEWVRLGSPNMGAASQGSARARSASPGRSGQVLRYDAQGNRIQ